MSSPEASKASSWRPARRTCWRAALQEALEHTRWNLWHGKVKRAQHWLRLLEAGMWHFASRYSKFSALARALHGFQRYLWRNGHLRQLRPTTASWPADLHRLRRVAGQSLLSKRFAKKQSMQWTSEGARLLLQVRTRTLNDDLAAIRRLQKPGNVQQGGFAGT